MFIPKMQAEGNSPTGGQPIVVNVPPANEPSKESIQTKIEKAAKKAHDRGVERGARNVLKSAGVPKTERDAVLADIAAGRLVLAPKPAADALDYKAEYEKLKPIATEHEQTKAKLAKHGEFFKKIADDEFTKLPESAQKYIAQRAGDDPEQRLAEIQSLRESGLLPAATTPAATETREAKPATTLATPGPKQDKPADQKTAWQEYEQLKKTSSALAAHYYRANSHAIDASRPKQQ